MHPWHHYVALGDSFTEGVGDPVEGFEMLGAMDRLAAALRQTNPALQVTNLAKRGLVLVEIREQQLEEALRLKPDFVSVVGGANNILSGRFDSAKFEDEFETLLAALTASGARVRTGNLPNFPIIATLREPLQARLSKNLARANAIIARLATRHGAILVDAWGASLRADPADWCADNLHLNARGYFNFAAEIIRTIEEQAGVTLGEIEAS